MRDRFVFLLLTFLVSGFAQAQTVEKAQGTQVIISVQGSESIQMGEKVHFLSNNLEIVGRGEVTKVSEGGKKAIVRLTTGKASKGMNVERIASMAAPPPAQNPSLQNPYETESPYYPPNLSHEDLDILRIGPISDTQYIAGGLLGIYPGLGLGHVVQGRWQQKGWVFTLGEAVSGGVVFVGILRCLGTSYDDGTCTDGLLAAGIVGFYAFKIWEIFDVWWTPRGWNDRYYQLRRRPSNEVSAVRWDGMILPTKDGVAAGIRMTF